MWSYLVRRLLLMIPTLFGVTIVSFVIMQLAPGDPLLTQVERRHGRPVGQTREAYLLQKRELHLDKPLVLNFNDFRDYSASVARGGPLTWARTVAQIAGRTARAGDGRADPCGRRRARRGCTARFLRSLPIPGFRQAAWLTRADAGPCWPRRSTSTPACIARTPARHGVPAAIELLRSDADLRMKIGAIRCLSDMVPEPFRYTYSRARRASETPPVERPGGSGGSGIRTRFAPVDRRSPQVLDGKLAQMAAAPDKLYSTIDEIGNSDFNDVTTRRFFAEMLLAADTPLAEKADRRHVSMQFNNKPLTDRRAARRAVHWMKRSGQPIGWRITSAPGRAISRRLAAKLWHVVADTQYAHMVWRLVTFNSAARR